MNGLSHRCLAHSEETGTELERIVSGAPEIVAPETNDAVTSLRYITMAGPSGACLFACTV